MSSVIPENANEGESILPEVEELSEFHPDHLSSLVDIHEELERLAASQNGAEELMEMPSVVDVDDVDHEVTIVAEQENEDTSILPDIKQNSKSIKETVVTICEGYNEIMIADNHEQTIPHEETLLNSMDNEFELNNPNQLKHSELVIGQSSVITPKLTMRSLPVTEILKSKKPGIGIVQQKSNVLTKVVLDPKKQSSTDASIIYGDKIRVVGQNKSTLLTNSSKTITVNQAREMGILSTGKLQQILPNHSKGLFKKSVMINPNKALAMIKSSPTKILPLPAGGQLHSIASSCSSVNTLSVSSTPNKLFIRQPSTSVKHTNFSGTILATTSAGSQGPIVQLPVSRDNNQIHQIHLPGKQVQYVRLVTSNAPSSNVSSNSSSEIANKVEPFMLTQAVEQPIPVALTSNIASATCNLKMMPIAPAQPVKTVSPNTSSFERVLVSPGVNQLTAKPDAKPPASNIVMVPAEYVKQYKSLPTNTSPTSPPKPVVPPPPQPPLPTINKEVISKETVTTPTAHRSKLPSEPPNGIRPRKPCNCTKSQCLKLDLLKLQIHAFQS